MKLVGRNFFEPDQAAVIQQHRWVLVSCCCCCPALWLRDGAVRASPSSSPRLEIGKPCARSALWFSLSPEFPFPAARFGPYELGGGSQLGNKSPCVLSPRW